MYTFLLVVQYISILFLLLESGYILARLRTRLHGLLFFNCVATLVNNVGYLMEMLAKTEEQYLAALQMSYLGRVWIPYSLFIFMIAICKIKFSRRILSVLAGIHVITYVLVLTSQWQPLYYATREYVDGPLFPYLNCKSGIWHILYSGLLLFYIVYGVIALIQTVQKEKNPLAKKQLSYILTAIVVESAFYIVNLVGITDNYDVTVLGYSVSTIFMYIAIFKYGLLDTLSLVKEYVIDEVSEGILAYDNNDKLEYANKPAIHIFADLFQNAESVRACMNHAVEQGTPLEVEGKIYSVESQQLLQNDIPQGTVYVLVDDTDHYNYMNELKRQKEIAEEANESKSAFLSIVSHEIRTPMNAIVGMTDLLLRDELTDKQRKYMTNIKNSGAALVMIINDILDKSKIEAGKMEIVEDVYEFRAMVEDVQMIIENRIGSKPIHLMISVDENLPKYLVGDALRLRQIFINLMNNAVKFTESGYIQLSVQILQETDEKFVIRFAVKDSGQGIRRDDLAKLGEAFAQVDTKRNHRKEGTGLGLSISKDFIRMMGGDLKVESEYGQGSEFYFTISQGKADENSDAIVKQVWRPRQFKAPDARVLVVDDTDINRMIIKELLAPLEMSVDTVDSGEKAVEMIINKQYHTVFMDYMMPGMDGVETTGQIRGLALTEEDSERAAYLKMLPIIALTGDTSTRTMELFKMAGIDDFVEKPVELERLKTLLLKWLPEDLIQQK